MFDRLMGKGKKEGGTKQKKENNLSVNTASDNIKRNKKKKEDVMKELFPNG